MKTFKYEVDLIIKRGDLLDEKRSKIKTTSNVDMPYSNNNHITGSSSAGQFHRYDKKISYREDKVSANEEFVKLISTLKTSNLTLINVNDSKDLSLTNNNTAVERVRGDDSSKVCITADKVVEYTGTIEVSFIVHKSEAFNIFIGFVEEGSDLSKGASGVKTSWLAYLNGGRFSNASEPPQFFKPYNKPEKDNAVFTIYIDTTKDEIWMKVDGNEESAKIKLVITEEQKKKLLPVIDFRKVGDKIAIH